MKDGLSLGLQHKVYMKKDKNDLKSPEKICPAWNPQMLLKI